MSDHPYPGGGCLLTYEGFAAKVREPLARGEGLDPWNVSLLRIDRHFRLPGGTKLVVGKSAEENERLAGLAKEGAVIPESASAPDPTALAYGPLSPDDLLAAAGLVARYTDKPGEGTVYTVACRKAGEEKGEKMQVEPLPAETVVEWMVGAGDDRVKKDER